LAAVSLAWLLAGCDRGEKPASAVVVLRWRRDVLAGSTVSGADVAAIELPATMRRSLGDVLSAGDLRLFSQPVHVGRSVRKDDFVRRGDLVMGRGAVPAPGPPGERTAADFRDAPVGDPEEMEAEGKHEVYLTTMRVADAAEMAGGPSAAAPGAASVPEAATQPLVGTGMQVLGDDVPGVFVPPGSRRLYGFRQKVPDGYSDNLACLVAKRLAAVEDFYRTRLPEAGYKLVGRGPTMRRDDGISLVFARAGKHYYFVNLYSVDKGKQTKIVLMIGRPGSKPNGGDRAGTAPPEGRK
jgi:hypothetical protein